MFLKPKTCDGVVTVVDKKRVERGCGLGASVLEVRKKGLVRLDW